MRPYCRPDAISDFVSVSCEQCGEQFTAHPGSNAADRGFCSPACALE